MTIEYVDNWIFLMDVVCFRAADGDVLPGPLLWGGHCADFHLRGRIRVLNRVTPTSTFNVPVGLRAYETYNARDEVLSLICRNLNDKRLVLLTILHGYHEKNSTSEHSSSAGRSFVWV